MKARYSGGVWGGEGTQGNRMSVTGTPGRWALRGRGGAISATSRVHGVARGASAGRPTGRVDNNGTGNQGVERGTEYHLRVNLTLCTQGLASK